MAGVVAEAVGKLGEPHLCAAHIEGWKHLQQQWRRSVHAGSPWDTFVGRRAVQKICEDASRRILTLKRFASNDGRNHPPILIMVNGPNGLTSRYFYGC
jgi:hypothetical protein